jgi:RNA polymerase sigma-70 factor, ECF subfamily
MGHYSSPDQGRRGCRNGATVQSLQSRHSVLPVPTLGPQDLEDKVHDTFLIVVDAIRRGNLREPERLMGFVRTVVRRQVANYIEQVVRNRRELVDFDSTVVYSRADRADNPEQQAIIEEKAAFVQTVLAGLSKRDQDLLVRFYLQEQTIAQICAEMALTATQFQLLKSRARARFGDLGRRRLERPTAEVRGLRSLSVGSTP